MPALPHLRLKKGVVVVPRPPGLVQVGSDPRQRVLLPDTEGVQGLLEALTGPGVRVSTAPVSAELERLVAADLVVDTGDRAQVRRRRATHVVRVHGPEPWAGDLGDLLAANGVGVRGRSQDPGLEVVLGAGEPARELADSLLAEANPVLYVSALDARVRVGPFVVPGLTACLRCLDAHAYDQDGRHPPALEEAVRRRVEHPLDLAPLAMTAALTLAARDILAWVEGREPPSWSASTWVSDDLSQETRRWTRHPHCGCSWQDHLRVG